LTSPYENVRGQIEIRWPPKSQGKITDLWHPPTRVGNLCHAKHYMCLNQSTFPKFEKFQPFDSPLFESILHMYEEVGE
jgi:hypothetical protein